MKLSIKMPLAALITVTVYSQCFGGFGKSGWQIFNKIQSVQSRGIASATGSEATSFLSNPAVLGIGGQRQIALLSENGAAGDSFGGIAMGMPLHGGMLGACIAYYDAGSVELNWVENGELRSRTAAAQRDILAAGAYGKMLSEKFFGGAALKASRSELAESAQAYAFALDLGSGYIHSENLTFNLSIQNMGFSTKFLNSASPLPSSAYFGAGYTYRPVNTKDAYLLGTAGVTRYMVDSKTVAELGAEAGLGAISLNAGYRFDVEDLNLHLGLRILWENISFGYAYVPASYLNSLHRLSLGFFY